MIHTSKPNTWDVKAEGSRTQGQLHLQSEFKISQGYRRLFQNQKIQGLKRKEKQPGQVSLHRQRMWSELLSVNIQRITFRSVAAT